MSDDTPMSQAFHRLAGILGKIRDTVEEQSEDEGLWFEASTAPEAYLQEEHRETATKGGHAAAIGRTIEYLTTLLPDAIAKDHELHDKGENPPEANFGRSK